MCLNSTVVLRVGTGEPFVEGGSSEVDGCFSSSTRCVNAQGSEPAPVSGPQFHVLGCRESAIHQGRHGVAQRRFDLAASELVQLGGLFGDDCRPKSRCGRPRWLRADAGFHVSGASEVREQLVRVGFNAPQWWDLRAGLRPPGQRVDERHV